MTTTNAMTRPIDFVGDLSIADAHVLLQYAKRSSHILEFGVGGSTQIFAQQNPKMLVCVETDPTWASIVTDKITHDFPKASKPIIIGYTNRFHQRFDIIFVDGVDDKRLDFARGTWHALNNGGVMLFHDTRRQNDLRNALTIAHEFGSEVQGVLINYLDSNITVLYKSHRQLQYENWQEVEGLPAAAYNLLL